MDFLGPRGSAVQAGRRAAAPPMVLAGDVFGDLPEVTNHCLSDEAQYKWVAPGGEGAGRGQRGWVAASLELTVWGTAALHTAWWTHTHTHAHMPARRPMSDSVHGVPGLLCRVAKCVGGQPQPQAQEHSATRRLLAVHM